MLFLPGVLLSAFFFSVFFIALQKCKKGQFYSDTKFLIPAGIFVWGDALVLGLFWGASFLFLPFLPLIFAVRYVLLFGTIRNMYEVIYWIGHQYAKSTYNPPLFRKISWIKPNESAILYQVMCTCQVVIYVFLLLLSYS